MIFRINTLSLLCSIFASTSVHAFENLNSNKNYGQARAYVGGNVLNPHTDIVVSNATILVDNGKITKIQPHSEKVPSNYEVTSLDNKWVIPGLIDGHVHLSQSGSAFTRPDTINAVKIETYQADQQWLLDNLSSLLGDYLSLGITTIFDMGGPSEYIEHYKSTTQTGFYPDIYAAGSLLSPMPVPQLDHNGKIFTQVTNAEQAIAQVQNQLSFNTNIVKIVWSQETGMTAEQLMQMYQPAIAVAKKHNKTVAVHVEGLENAKQSIKAGADILVHGVFTNEIDEEIIELMKANDVTYMPTLSAYDHYMEIFSNQLTFSEHEKRHSHSKVMDSFSKLMANINDTDQMFKIFLTYIPKVDSSEQELAAMPAQDQSIIKQLRTMFSSDIQNHQMVNLRKVIASGVNVAFGTDAGNPGTLHASSVFGEMKAWQQAGISNKDILKAATFANANALNLSDRVGELSSGKFANFVVLAQNPYEQLETLKTPIMTVKGGQTAFSAQEENNE